MDNELFELCKEVYERLEWQIDDATWVVGDENGDLFILSKEIEAQGHFDFYAPLYTSDYLLERLPVKVVKDERSHWFSLHPLDSQGSWGAVYCDETGPSNLDIYGTWSDTPLKALLKLTLALAQAGELK